MEESQSIFATKKSLGGGQVIFTNLQSKMRTATSIPELIHEITQQANENGLLPLKIISTIFQKYGIYLEPKEAELINRRYISPHGSIQVLKLLKALDIGMPSDYLEIDKFQDPLPQPYRMISKLLELEIIDRAWLEILRKYPEVQEEIPGRNMIMRRNKNLDIECFPSNQSERTQNIAAITGCEHLILAVNDAGTFTVLDIEDGKFLHTLQIFPEDLFPSEFVQYSLTPPSSVVSPFSACRVAVIKLKMLPQSPPEPEPEESEKEKKAKAAAAASKKTPTKGKGPVVPDVEPEKKPSPTHRISVGLIDLLHIHSSNIQCNLVYSFDFNLLSGEIHCEFSSDGRSLIVSHGTEIAFFKFPPVNSSEDLFGPNLGKILEADGDSVEEGIDMKSPTKSESKVMEPQSVWSIPDEILKQTSALEKPQLTSSMIKKSSSENQEGSKKSLPPIKSCHFFSFGSDFNWEDPPVVGVNPAISGPGSYAKRTSYRDNSSVYHNGMIVFLEDYNRWFIFGLRSAAPPPPPRPQVSPRSEAKKDKNAAPPPPPEPVIEDPSKRVWVLDLLRQFPLSSPVTTVEFDTHRSLLILGQTDGIISIWDLKGMMLISIPTRHQSAVTSLCLIRGVSSHYLVSGDTDGVLCFHKLHVAAGLKSEILSTVDTLENNSILTAELIDFRLDFTRESIVRIWAVNGGVSIVVVQVSSGRLVAYDADGAELLGRLSLTSGVLGLRMEYSLALTHESFIINPSTISNETNIDPTPPPPPPPPPPHPHCPPPIIKSQTQLFKEKTAIASSCSNGFSAFFFRSNLKPVISSFNLSKFLSFYYPGISSLTKTSLIVKGKVLTPLVLYKLLTPAQRMDPKLKSSQVSFLRDKQNEDPQSLQESKSGGKFSRTSSRATTLTAPNTSSSNLLTMERLKELEKSYQVLDSTPTLLPALGEFSASRITTPKLEFEKSVKISQNERMNRKINVVNSLKQLSGLL